MKLPAPTVLDRLIAVVSPRMAAERATRRAMGAGTFGAYSDTAPDGGGRSPLNTRWSVTPRSASADTLRALPRQRAESRELVRVNPIACGAVGTMRNRIVGTGLVPVPEPDAKLLGMTPEEVEAWVETASREFSIWADSPECIHGGDGNTNFFLRQGDVLEGRLVSGDCATLLTDADAASITQPYRLRLQLIEADRIGNPSGATDSLTMVQGVKLGADGGPVEYHVYNQHPGNGFASASGDKYAGRWISRGSADRRNVLHHVRAPRPEQVRGVPWLSVVAHAIKDLGRYTEAEITAAVTSAYYTVFVKRPKSGAPAHIDPGFDEGGNPIEPPASGGGAGAGDYQLGVGAFVGLEDGEEVEFANPTRPNAAYSEFVRQIYGEIAVGLHMPRSLLLKVFDASYTASRAELLDAWQNFRVERYWLQISFCQPVYEAWLTEAVAIGRIQAPGFFDDAAIRWAYCRASWHGDSMGSLNPKDEVAAYRDAIDGRLSSPQAAEWALFGTDWTATYGTKLNAHRRMQRDEFAPVARAGAAPAPALSTPAAPAPQKKAV
jgi:lambda family phage portal protein